MWTPFSPEVDWLNALLTLIFEKDCKYYDYWENGCFDQGWMFIVPHILTSLTSFFCLIKRAKIDVLFERGFHKKVINSAFRIPFKLTCMLILRYWKYIQNKGLRRKENSSFTILFTLSLDRFMILCYAVNLKVLLLSINNKWQRTFQKHVAIFQATQTWETWSDCPEIISKKIELLKVAVALILHSLT